MSTPREIVRAALDRANERAAPPSASGSPASPHDAMQWRLIEQWATVIGPALVVLKEELASAGLMLDFVAPGESNDGHIDLEIGRSENHWNPSVRFSATNDGKQIDVTLTAGR